jgi:hypothetical protein
MGLVKGEGRRGLRRRGLVKEEGRRGLRRR